MLQHFVKTKKWPTWPRIGNDPRVIGTSLEIICFTAFLGVSVWQEPVFLADFNEATLAKRISFGQRDRQFTFDTLNFQVLRDLRVLRERHASLKVFTTRSGLWLFESRSNVFGRYQASEKILNNKRHKSTQCGTEYHSICFVHCRPIYVTL